MPHSAPIGIRHEIFVLAGEGMQQGHIAGRVSVARKNANRIAIASLDSGKSCWVSALDTQVRILLEKANLHTFDPKSLACTVAW